MKDAAGAVSSISILSSEYDTFPEVSSLNTSFRTFTQKLKVSLEIDSMLAAGTITESEHAEQRKRILDSV